MSTPSEYAQQVERIRARRAVAAQLAQQAMNTDLGQTQMAGRIAIARSPLEGLAQLAQSYQSNRIRRKSESDESAAATKRAAEVQAAMATMNSQQPGNEAARAQAMSTVMEPEDIAKQQVVSDERKLEFEREQAARTAERDADAKVGAEEANVERLWRSGESKLARDAQLRLEQLQRDTQKEIADMRTGITQDKAAQSMRKEFRKLPSVKDYENVLPLLNSMKNTPDTPAGDLEVVYTVGKILDPDSVIREGELVLTQNASPLLSQLVGTARKQLAAKGRITPEMRKDFVNMLQQRVDTYGKAYERDRTQYEQLAREEGFDPNSIIGTHAASAFPAETQPKTQEAAAAAPPVNLLKPGVQTKFKGMGTWILGPDGKPQKVAD